MKLVSNSQNWLKKIIYRKTKLLIICLSLWILNIPNAWAVDNDFLVISDIHLDLDLHQPMNFQPRTRDKASDLDKKSFIDMLATTQSNIAQGIIPNPQFILLLGDLVGHKVPKKMKIATEKNVFQLMKHYFPGIPIIYIFGNNDALNYNYDFFKMASQTGENSPWDIAVHQGGWRNGFLSTGLRCSPHHTSYPCLLNEDRDNGFSALQIAPHFRLLAFNSVLFSDHISFSPLLKKQKIHQELAWLEAQLAQANQQHEAVLLACHIPPGKNVHDNSSFWTSEAQKSFMQMQARYHTTIVGLLAGHTHKEEIKMIRNNKTILGGVYQTAALSTLHGNCPLIKSFHYGIRQNTWVLLNYDAFYFYRLQNEVKIKKLYNYKQHYCPKTTTPTLMACLTNVDEKNMADYFNAGNIDEKDRIFYPEAMTVF